MGRPLQSLFNPKEKSLPRGAALSLGAMAASMLIAGFPYIQDLHGSPWQLPLIPVALAGLVDTFRCLDRRWSLRHASVLILIYSELMVLALIIFLGLYDI